VPPAEDEAVEVAADEEGAACEDVEAEPEGVALHADVAGLADRHRDVEGDAEHVEGGKGVADRPKEQDPDPDVFRVHRPQRERQQRDARDVEQRRPPDDSEPLARPAADAVQDDGRVSPHEQDEHHGEDQ